MTARQPVIRQFNMRDYNEVLKLWLESGLDFRPGDRREEMKTKLTRDRDLFLVAQAEGEIVGVAMGTWDGRRGWIHRLAVKGVHRHRRIATALVTEIEQRLAAKGAMKVDTLVRKDNVASLGFFDSLGYERDPEYMLLGKLLVKNWRRYDGIDRSRRLRVGQSLRNTRHKQTSR